MKGSLLILTFSFCAFLFAQNYPVFGPQKKVTITGLTHDAMEPFLSEDGQTLFFNSINSGGNTNLYYATRINDTLFTYEGLVIGTYDTSAGHLDAVASLDMNGRFFWVSLRDYPSIFENLMNGDYASGNVSNLKHTYGDFNIYSPGWLIMDAAISHDGDFLYYVNAWFNSCDYGMPCISYLGVAEKMNDTTFNKLSNSDAIFYYVNDTDYITYAPQVSTDGKELYFTRIEIGTVNSELCVSVREDITDTFSIPQVIYSNNGFVPEATTVSFDKSKIYYHQKDSFGLHEIYMRYKIAMSEIDENKKENFGIYPNPVNDILYIQNFSENISAIRIYNSAGILVQTNKVTREIVVTHLPEGVYFIELETNKTTFKFKFVKLG